MRLKSIKKRNRNSLLSIKRYFNCLQKVSQEIENKNKQISELDLIVCNVENHIFEVFCRRLAITDIRAYEENHFNINKEKKEYQLKYCTEKAKLNNQYHIYTYS